MEKLNVINYHVSMQCNYHCKFCYAKCKTKALPLSQQLAVCDAAKEFFIEQGFTDGRINFAGGEPLLHKEIFELLLHCKSIGTKTSIITNGSLLTENTIKKLADNGVDMIGISVDSLSEDTNKKLGRCTADGKTLSLSYLVLICKLIKTYGMKLKINSCVTKCNCTENIAPLLSMIEYDRFKILKAQKIAGINDSNSNYIDDVQFKDYCDRHIEYMPIVEGNSDIENSYIIIHPNGYLLDNQGARYRYIGNCIENKISDLLKRIMFNHSGFFSRYRE